MIRSPALGLIALASALALAGCSCENSTAAECRFDLDCPKGQFCNEKKCLAPPKCPDTPCAAGQSCLAGSCFNKDCASTSCGADQVCAFGSCTDTVCIGVSCQTGQTCAKGQCYSQSCPTEACAANEVCSGGACTPKGCAGVSCSAGQQCAGAGQCYPKSCATGPCNQGQLCVSGTCTENRCVGVTCDTGFACAQGQCQSTACGASSCPPGQVCGGTGCIEAVCATVVCPGGYRCGGGVCVPSLTDGGVPRLPDGGPAVVLGPDGGVVGLVGPDGGLLRGPDGGAVGGPCLPGACDEIDCADGVDNDVDGVSDCADPTCEALRCADENTCSTGELCSAGACVPAQTVTCAPAANECFRAPVCDEALVCHYPPNPGTPCDGGICFQDGGCGPPTVGPIPFGYTPTNFNPGSLSPSGTVTVGNMDAGSGAPVTIGYDTGGGGYSGSWGGTTPGVYSVTLPSGGGQATVLAMQNLNLGENVTMRLTGPRPVILAIFGDANIRGNIDAAAKGALPGPGGNHSYCASSGTGGLGGTANGTAGGGGGAGARSPGGVGGAGSFGGTGGSAGAQRGAITLAPLQGGCPGGAGGNGGGAAGAGGGALQISASGIIGVSGFINVSGGGGLGGAASSATTSRGGGGGGSGGGLFMEAFAIALSEGGLVANGGSGGEGSAASDAGEDGHDGWYTTEGTDGGYLFAPLGGNGGMGGARNIVAQRGEDGVRWALDAGYWDEAAGGGGGGAAGYIRVNVAPLVCQIPQDLLVSPHLTNAQGGSCNNGP